MAGTMWELAKQGKFTDLILVEDIADNPPRAFTVHKAVLYMHSKFLKNLFDSPMEDNSTDKITVPSSNGIPVLEQILEATYNSPIQIYTDIYAKQGIDTLASMYDMCEYLGLGAHQEIIIGIIKKNAAEGALIDWWKRRQALDQEIPTGIDEAVQEYFRKHIAHLQAGSDYQAFISLEALLQLWPKDCEGFGKYLYDMLKEIAANASVLKEADNPNGWMEFS